VDRVEQKKIFHGLSGKIGLGEGGGVYVLLALVCVTIGDDGNEETLYFLLFLSF